VETTVMPSAEILITFFLTTLLFAYMPGPALLYTAAQTVARGRAAGLMAALGLHLGGYVHVTAAAAGLSVVFHLVPPAYLAVKLAGAAYLVWLGVAMFRRKDAGAAPDAPAGSRSGRRAFIESITVEILNPKTAIFFLAFLPQFADPAAAFPVWAQLAILGVIVNLTFSSADLVCVVLAGALVKRLKSSGGAQRLLRKAGGAVLVGLGVNLALQRG
jgi:threonine/homoserine/homoserine lactone efflux protein